MADQESINFGNSVIAPEESFHFNNSLVSNSSEPLLKLSEFSKYLLGPGRLQLKYAKKNECEEIIYLLLNLKKEFKHILTELGKSHSRKDYSFICAVCDEQLIVPHTNFWEVLQNHEHVEDVFQKCLSGSAVLTEETEYYNSEVDELELNDSLDNNKNNDSDSDIGTEQVEIDQFDDIIVQCDETNVNSFRFDFVPSYDDGIQTILYPEKLVRSLRKYDTTQYPTILSVGPSRAACLLCSCDIMGKNKVRMGRHFYMDHITGNKHMRQAQLTDQVNALTNFHESWLNKEVNVQAHQVYFRPEQGNIIRCVLCGIYVPLKKVEEHILANIHRFKVLEVFQKNSKSFNLMNFQVQLYGVAPKQLPKTDSPVRVKEKNNINNEKARNNKELNNKKVKTENQIKKSDRNDEVDEDPHNIIKSIKNSLSPVLSEIIPNRFKNHSQYFNRHGNVIKCMICQINFTCNISNLIGHIYDRRHMGFSRTPLCAYNYYCEICNLKIADEINWLKHFADASRFHAKVPESRKNKLTEYECTKCLTIIYGDELSLTRHLATKRGGRKPQEIKLAASILKVFKNRETIEAEAEKLVLEANETLECNGPTMTCCRSVEQLLTPVFEGCKAYPFGSRISGLGNQKSDLDLFLDIGNMYTGNHSQDSLQQVVIVKKVFSIMVKAKEEFNDVFHIPTARTPIVKFHHKSTDIDCDLSFRHGLSVENTKFLRFCFDLQPMSQSFILVLKMWSHQNNISEHITTYALAIMGIFYLQTKGYLISVKQLRELNENKGLTIYGWETVEYNVPLHEIKKYVKPYSGSVVELLKGFFMFYSKFSHSVDVICPLLGRCIKKSDFNDNGKRLPPEMHSYRAQLHSREPEPFRNASALCIQDPFDLSHNLTKALQPHNLNKLRILCEMSYKLLETS